MSKTTNKFSPEVRERAIQIVLDHESEQPSRWVAVSSIAAKIGCSPATQHEWVKKTEIDSGKRAGLPSDMAEKMKALERENRFARRTRYCERRLLISPRRSSTAPSNDDLVVNRRGMLTPSNLSVQRMARPVRK